MSHLVSDIHPLGYGVIKPTGGKIWFAAGVCPGDQAEFEVVDSHKSHDFVVAKRLLIPSPYRVKPFCIHHGFTERNCGGCPWGFIDYDYQIDLKKRIIKSQLDYHKIEFNQDILVYPTAPNLGYRSTARFQRDGSKVGFYAYKSNNVINIDHCPVLDQSMNQKLKKMQHSPGEQNIGSTFKQANEIQNKNIKSALRVIFETIPPQNRARILELFSGSGNFTQVIREYGEVLALEKVHQAVDEARSLHSFSNVEFRQADLYRSIAIDFCAFDGVFLNPPRSGWNNIAPLVRKYLNIKWVIYVSCSIQNQLKDLKSLRDIGTIDSLTGFDMFPHTPHFESVVLWRRNLPV